MEIRELSEEDFEEVVELFFTVKREDGYPVDEGKRAVMLEMLKEIREGNSSTALVAVESKGVSGFINAVHCPLLMLAADEWYLTEFFILSDYRGHGVGRALLAELERRAMDAGARQLCLHNFRTTESYKRGFYRKAGFTEIKEIACFVKR